VRVDAAEAREIAVPRDALAGVPQWANHLVQVAEEDAWVPLARRTEVFFNPEVKFQSAGAEPWVTSRPVV
jgi:hypothetical protein